MYEMLGKIEIQIIIALLIDVTDFFIDFAVFEAAVPGI